MFKKLCVICLALCLGAAAVSCAKKAENNTADSTDKTAAGKTETVTEEEEEIEENPGFEYKFSGQTAVLLSYDGEDEVIDLTQPIIHLKKNKKTGEKEPHEYELITVESGAFKNCETVKKIILPDTVEEIGEAAFQNCTALEEVVLPAKLTAIAPQLFYGCSALTTVNIPDTVSEVGVFAFGDYFNHTPWYDAQTDENVIIGDGVLLKHNGDAATVRFDDSVKTIAYYAFLESKAGTVYFTDSVESFDPLAMYRAGNTTFMFPTGSKHVKTLRNGGISAGTYDLAGAAVEESEEAVEEEPEEVTEEAAKETEAAVEEPAEEA